MNHAYRSTAVVALAAGALFLADDARAQEVVDLGEIVVTAGRTPAPSAAVGTAHTVITGEELEERQVRYVADALRQVPGVAVSRTGGSGGLTQVRMRGAEGNHVLVMIDGVEVGEVSSGEFDFGGLLAADIERIEVLRGPQSAFWGSNATAGVINIITKSGNRAAPVLRMRTEVGTDGTALANPFVSGGGERFDFAVSGAFRRNDGFNISDFGAGRDGHRNATVNGKVNVDLARNMFLDANLRVVDRNVDTDRQDFSGGPLQGLVVDADDGSASRELFGGAGVTWELLDGAFTQTARVRFGDVERENFTDRVVSSANQGDRVSATYQASLRFDTPEFARARHTLTGGTELKRETFRNLPPITDPSQRLRQVRDLHGYVGEYRGEFFERLFVTAALRHDVNDAFENATTYSLSGAYLVPATGTRLHGSVGTGVTNPTFFEQFGFVPAQFQGNPGLKPEESFGWDIGVEQTLFDGALVADVTYFKADLTNEIATDFSVFPFTPVNLPGESPRQGVEVSLTARPIDGLSLTGSYTYTDASDPTGLVEVRRPRHKAAFNATYAFLEGRANVFADVVYNGRMEDDEFINFGRVTLDDYVLVNVGADYSVNERLTLYGRVENLFDERYEEVFGFNTAGITAYAGMRFALGGDPL